MGNEIMNAHIESVRNAILNLWNGTSTRTGLPREEQATDVRIHISVREMKAKSVPRTESTKQGRSKERSRTENKQCTTSGPSDIWEGRLSTNENMSDLFRSLIKLCTEIVQDANTLSREEDKLRAFTDLSAELSQASNGSAITVAPTLAAAITSHGECKERIEQHTQELETLWASLFSALERNIVKAVETHLKTAVAMLQEKGRNSDERSRSLADGSLPVVKRRRIGTPEPMETDQELGESLRGLLQGMKSQMDEQTRAIERLSKENQQVELQLRFEYTVWQADNTSIAAEGLICVVLNYC
ncbi:hypothetical protein J3A83DRAFT_3704119 [Scleroderma citrinum]